MRGIKQLTIIILLAFIGHGASWAGNNIKYVDLFIGTAGDNGQVDPAACVPYGMARVCPDSDPRSHSGYDYYEPVITGFSVNRISGIGCGGAGGNLSVKPEKMEVKPILDKDTEIAIPGFYRVTLNNGVKAELTATHNVAVERYHYPVGHEAVMTFDAASTFTRFHEASLDIISDTEIEGFVKCGNTCDHGAYKLYFNLKTSHPFKETRRDGYKTELWLGEAPTEAVEVRIALSPIDTQTARKENAVVNGKSFEAIKTEADRKWDKILNKIDVAGGTEDDRIIFYTSLYRVFLSPANATSHDNRFLGTDGQIRNTGGHTYYSSWSMWDSYRTKFSLITLLDPATMSDISESLCRLFQYGKRDWATPFESTPTVRTEHSMVVLLDAYEKGIRGFDMEAAYPNIKKEADNLKTERPDQAFETCIDLWALSRIAEILGHTQDAAAYGRKADSLFLATWENEFKNIDENFSKMRGSGLYQGNRWQYRWALPQYADVMAETSGGYDVLADQLDYFFTHSLNNQGNEPGLHAPFLFNMFKRPDKTQEIVTRMLTEEMKHVYGGNAEYSEPIYSRIFKNHPEGFLYEMDEDDGTMCAWYVFGSIGIFPLIIGDKHYEISSPIFDRIDINLDNGKNFRIIAKNRKSKYDTIKKIRMNGKTITGYRIDHNKIAQGGVLELRY